MSGYVAVAATCRTTDGRKVGVRAPVTPALLDDEPVVRAFLLDELRRTAAAGDPPGEIDAGTLELHALDPRLPE